MRRLILLSFLSLFFVSFVSSAPVFEHSQPKPRDEVRCEVCQAVIQQLYQRLPPLPSGIRSGSKLSSQQKLSRSTSLTVLFETICSPSSFPRYKFAPPTMVKACEDFLSDQEERLEKELFEGIKSEVQLRDLICVKRSRRCKTLWNSEEEQTKRERTPEELKEEREKLKMAQEEHEKKKKEEKKAKKKQEREQKKKQKQEAANESSTTATSPSTSSADTVKTDL